MEIKRYKANLRIEDNHKIYSYNILVGIIYDTHIREVDWWNYHDREDAHGKIFKKQSPTTKKHLNYVAELLGKKLLCVVLD